MKKIKLFIEFVVFLAFSVVLINAKISDKRLCGDPQCSSKYYQHFLT